MSEQAPGIGTEQAERAVEDRGRPAEAGKKRYTTPRLEVWGAVTELTRGSGGSKGDGRLGKTRRG